MELDLRFFLADGLGGLTGGLSGVLALERDVELLLTEALEESGTESKVVSTEALVAAS